MGIILSNVDEYPVYYKNCQRCGKFIVKDTVGFCSDCLMVLYADPKIKNLEKIKKEGIKLYKAVRNLQCCKEGAYTEVMNAMEDFRALIGPGKCIADSEVF